jgi:diaminopimelate epimerase
MKINFFKYQGTGNDFIIIDNRMGKIHIPDVAKLCNRRFGIGADGLMLLENAKGYDFKMVYFNSDGKESSMCGNGGRCLAAFAHKLQIGNNHKLSFVAIDGPHEAILLEDNQVKLKMSDVKTIIKIKEDFELNTGSPHYVKFVEQVQEIAIQSEAHKIRYADTYKQEGINVNFTQILSSNTLSVRTYERGVEDETYSCGTGVTACSLAYSEKLNHPMGEHSIHVNTPGGKLEIIFEKTENGFKNIWLCGPAVMVFEGTIQL